MGPVGVTEQASHLSQSETRFARNAGGCGAASETTELDEMRVRAPVCGALLLHVVRTEMAVVATARASSPQCASPSAAAWSRR